MNSVIKIIENTLPQVTTVGHYQVDEPWVHRERHLQINTMLFVEEGTVYICEDHKEYEVPKNHVFYFKKACKQWGNRPIPSGSKWYWVSFDVPDAKDQGTILPKLTHLTSPEKVFGIVRAMASLYNTNILYKSAILNGYLYQIFYELLSAENVKSNALSTNKIAPKVIRLLNEQLEGKFSADMISQKLGMNYSYLGRLFKAEKGMSINHYYMKLKVNQAINLLHTSHMNITEISEQLNYPNPYYFSRVFKQITGVSPKDYQEQMYR